MAVDSALDGMIERLWYGEPGQRAAGVRALGVLLHPAELLYRLAARGQRAWRAGKAVDVGCPVISVGNITVGGSGKSTMSLLLAREVAARGARPFLVAHAFRAVVTSREAISFRGTGDLPPVDAVGDEALMAALTEPDLTVTVGADKALSCRRAAREGAEVIVLDDGFHRLDIPRDLNLAVFDARLGIGNGACLPRGPLREPPSSLARADAVVVFTAPGSPVPDVLAAVCRRHCPGIPLLTASKRPTGFRWWTGRGLGEGVDLRGRAVHAFCGLGNPDSFRMSLEESGVPAGRFGRFPDHHAYRPDELDRLGRLAAESGADAVVTTLKDAVKIPRWPDDAPPLAVLTVDAVVDDPGGFLARRLDRLVESRR